MVIGAGGAVTAVSAGVSGRGRRLPCPGVADVTADPQTSFTAQRQAADGNGLLLDLPG